MSETNEERHWVATDDDQVMLHARRAGLEKGGYQVETLDRGKAGLPRLAEAPSALLIVDPKGPRIDGVEVARTVRRIASSVVIVVITGSATVASAVEAVKAGAYDFLPRPFSPDELRLSGERGHERWVSVRESEQLQREVELDLPSSLPCTIGDNASVDMLGQNPPSNAIKCNRPGANVRVVAWATGRSLVLLVQDTRIGIPTHAIPRLFNEPFRVKGETTLGILGTGLGHDTQAAAPAETASHETLQYRAHHR